MLARWGKGSRLRVIIAAAGTWLSLSPSPALSQEAAPDAQPIIESPRYPISRFVIEYSTPNSTLPDPDDVLRSARVTLGIGAGGYVEPREGVATVTLHVSDIADEPMRRFNLLAVSAVVQAVFDEYKRRGIIGVVVDAGGDIHLRMRRNPQTGQYELDTSDPDAGRDLRPQNRPDAQTELRLVVHTGVVSQVRTIASGDRIDPDQRLNNVRHARIREGSPVQPMSVTGDGPRRDLLRKDLVDAYMQRLNRHPGRRVDAAVSAGENQGEITLDYLVSENKPWTIYAQASNTGTKETNDWRERFGFSHNQLTGRDDILTLDYITAGFEDTNAVLASYEAPLGSSDLWRWKVYGSWNQFTASDVGASNQTFEGDGWWVGGELAWNFFQDRELFLDAVMGAKFQNITIDNQAAGTSGDEDFFLPSIGVRLERQTELSTTRGSLMLEGNLADLAGTDSNGVNDLGRLQVDDSWVTLKFDASHAFYLEPVLNRARWEDPSTNPTLAHELSLSMHGQWTPDARLVPSFEQVVGGFYSVRGYRESVAAGDTVVVASVEYRFHFPWSLSPAEPGRLFGRPFRYRPQQPYGRADWDLVARGFFDLGYAANNDKLGFEFDETLYGAGVGLELAFRRNVSVRVDWGVALTDTDSGQTVAGQFTPDVTAGSSRFHISATILY